MRFISTVELCVPPAGDTVGPKSNGSNRSDKTNPRGDGLTFVIETYPQPAQAQTLGMQRRQDRRATRHEAREDKRECNATGQGTRAECRQEKRDVRQERRSDRMAGGPSTPGTPP